MDFCIYYLFVWDFCRIFPPACRLRTPSSWDSVTFQTSQHYLESYAHFPPNKNQIEFSQVMWLAWLVQSSKGLSPFSFLLGMLLFFVHDLKMKTQLSWSWNPISFLVFLLCSQNLLSPLSLSCISPDNSFCSLFTQMEAAGSAAKPRVYDCISKPSAHTSGLLPLTSHCPALD